MKYNENLGVCVSQNNYSDYLHKYQYLMITTLDINDFDIYLLKDKSNIVDSYYDCKYNEPNNDYKYLKIFTKHENYNEKSFNIQYSCGTNFSFDNYVLNNVRFKK